MQKPCESRQNVKSSWKSSNKENDNLGMVKATFLTLLNPETKFLKNMDLIKGSGK